MPACCSYLPSNRFLGWPDNMKHLVATLQASADDDMVIVRTSLYAYAPPATQLSPASCSHMRPSNAVQFEHQCQVAHARRRRSLRRTPAQRGPLASPSSLHNRAIVRWPSSPAVQPSSAMHGSQIEAELERLGNVDCFSIIGYSMGGLIARYVVGKLYERGYFDKMQPLVRTAKSDPGVMCCVLIAKSTPFYLSHSRTLSRSRRRTWASSGPKPRGSTRCTTPSPHTPSPMPVRDHRKANILRVPVTNKRSHVHTVLVE